MPRFTLLDLDLAVAAPAPSAAALWPFAETGCFPAGVFPAGVPLAAMSSSNLLRLTSGLSNHGALPLCETLNLLGIIPADFFLMVSSIARNSGTVNLNVSPFELSYIDRKSVV